jgi:predicted MFS family arabinose efflux permease
VGGGLSQVFGWRSVFFALAALCCLNGLALLLLMRHETHHYFVLKRLAKKDPDAARGMKEWNSVMAAPPRFQAPWVPLRLVVAATP